MLKNYFKSAWRNLWKNKVFSLINITGLSLGMASVATLAVLINQYFTTDDFFRNKDRMYYLKTYTPDGQSLSQTTEIGIRKVLGASVTSVVALLSRDFVKLVLIAVVIATPLAWYIMQKWLEDFSYHIEIQWWMFALAGLLAVAIALLTVSFQSIKAALVNPVKSLRSD